MELRFRSKEYSQPSAKFDPLFAVPLKLTEETYFHGDNSIPDYACLLVNLSLNTCYPPQRHFVQLSMTQNSSFDYTCKVMEQLKSDIVTSVNSGLFCITLHSNAQFGFLQEQLTFI